MGKNNKIKTGRLYRSFDITRADGATQDDRTIEVAFSSEDPYPRWFGIEILDHGKKSIRMGRMLNKAPLLADHNPHEQIGVVEQASIDADKVCRAKVRFSKSAKAEEIFQDVLDGIKSKISVGYRVHKMILEETSDKGDDTYRVTDWEPLEISLVSVPADDTVGVGRSVEHEDDFETLILNKEKVMEKKEVVETKKEEVVVPQIDVAQIKADIKADMEKSAVTMVESARAAEKTRVDNIKAICDKHKMPDFGMEHVAKGTPLDEFKGLVLEKIANAKPVDTPNANLDMEKKDLSKYSILRAIVAASKNDWRGAEFERECSEAVENKLGKQAQGFFVPYDVMVEKRDLNVGTPTAGGNTVDTDLMAGSFIEMLRNKMVIRRLGATVLSGLVGDVAIPKQTGGATGYWLAEGADITESEQTIGQVIMTPKTVGALTELTRKLLQQSSMDMENFVRNDLATILALAMDLAAINGSGASNQPTGILNQAGVGLVAMGTNGLAPDFASIISLETEVSIDNADIGTMAYLTNAKVRGKMKATPKVSGYPTYLWENGNATGEGNLNGYRALVSNQVPSDLDKGTSTGVCSAMILGVWDQLLIGLWGGLDILADPYTKSASGGLRVTAFQDCDIAVRHPESFAVVKDYLA